MLIKIDKETLKLIDKYKKSKAEESDKLIAIRSSFLLLKKEIEPLEYEVGFFKKLEIKRDLKQLMKSFKARNNNIMSKITIINHYFNKLTIKYKARENYDSKKNIEKVDFNENDYVEEASSDLKDKIEKVYKKSKENRELNGVACIEPVQFISVDEINEAKERRKRIEKAINNKQLTKKEEEERRKRIEKAIINKQIAKKREEQRIEDAKTQEKIGGIVKKILEKKENDKEKSNIANQNENDTYPEKTLKPKRKKLAWYTSIPIIGTLIVSTFSGAVSSIGGYDLEAKSGEENDKENDNYLASLNSDDDSNTENKNVVSETTKIYESDEIKTNAKKEDVIIDEDDIEDKIEEKVEENIEQEEQVIVNIGDKIKVSNGLRYTANCLGHGNSNEIGAVSWRPATDYFIDKVAFCYDGKVLGIMNSEENDIENELKKYATQYKIDIEKINTSVLLSLVPGYHDTGWAQISIENLKQNKSNKEQNLNVENKNVENLDLDR